MHEATRGISTPPRYGAIVDRKVTPSSKWAVTYLYTWVKRGAIRLRGLVLEHHAVPRPWIEPGVQRTSHYDAAPVGHFCNLHFITEGVKGQREIP